MENLQKLLGGFKYTVRQCMRVNPILGFCDEPPGDKGDSTSRREHCTKMLFFVLFAHQEPPGASFIPPGAKLFISGR